MRKENLQEPFRQAGCTHTAENNLMGLLNRFAFRGFLLLSEYHGDLTSLATHKPYTGPAWYSIEFDATEI